VPTRFAHRQPLKTTTVAQGASPATTPEADHLPVDTDEAAAHSGGPADDAIKSTPAATGKSTDKPG